MENQEEVVENKVVEAPVENLEDKYKQLIREKDEQIEILVKQSELQKKVHKQVVDTLEKKVSESNEVKNPFEWVEKKIKNFNPKGYETFEEFRNNKENRIERLMQNHLKVLKDYYKESDEGAAKRVEGIFKVMNNK